MTDTSAIAYELLKDVTTPTVSGEAMLGSDSKSVQVKGLTTAGVGYATFDVEVSNDTTYPWIKAGELFLILGTTAKADGILLDSAWAYVRVKLVSISGTGAKVSASVGV